MKCNPREGCVKCDGSGSHRGDGSSGELDTCSACKGTGKAPEGFPMSLHQWYLMQLEWRPDPAGYWVEVSDLWESHPDKRERSFEERLLWEQVTFFRGTLGRLFISLHETGRDGADHYGRFDHVQVVSTHTSKSVLLPVVRILLGYGQHITIRDNWYGYKLSASLNGKFQIPFPEDIIQEGFHKPIHPVYFEGFSEDWIYGPYASRGNQFSIGLGGSYDVYLFCRVLLQWLRQQKKLGSFPEDRREKLAEAYSLLSQLSPAERRTLIYEMDKLR